MLPNGLKTLLPMAWGANDSTKVSRTPPLGGPAGSGADISVRGGCPAAGGLSAWPAQQQRAPLTVCVSQRFCDLTFLEANWTMDDQSKSM